MSELTSKSEVTPMEDVNSSGLGFDPDRRIAEQSIDGCHPPIEVNSPSQGFDPDRRITEQSVDGGHPSIDHEVGKTDSGARVEGASVAFKGFMNVDKIADVQFGGTCWAEAIEKAVQLVKGDKTGELNNLSSEIIARVISDPKKWDAVENKSTNLAVERWNILPERYPDMLKEFGVDAENRSFSHQELQKALAEHCPVLIGGDVKHLGKFYEGQSGGHVLLAIDWEPDTGKYVLLDSNFPNVYKVSPETLQKFATGSWNDKISDFIVGNMTVVKTPAQWTDWRFYVDGKWRLFVDGLEVRNPFQDFKDFTHKTNVDGELQGHAITVNTESAPIHGDQIEDTVGEWPEKLRSVSQLESQTVEKLRDEVSATDKEGGRGQVSFGGSCNGCSGTCHGSCSGSCAGSCDASKTGRDCYYK